MTDQEAYQVVCHPLPPRAPRRSMSLRIFLMLAALAVIGGALAAFNH